MTLTLALALLTLVSFSGCAGDAEDKSASAMAPAAYRFSLAVADGGTVELESLLGKVVFLDFWASWCPPCLASKPAVAQLHEKYADNENVKVIGINMENISKAREYGLKKNIKYINAVADDVTARRYGVRGIPTFILVDKKGNIAGRWVGFSDTLLQEWINAVDAALAYEPSPPTKKPSAPAKTR